MENVTWTDLDPLAFIFRFLNELSFVARLVCNFCEAMSESLPVASTAESSAKFATVDSGEDCRSAMYSRYNKGLRTLLVVR
jgi:hypothetical protein